MFKKKNFREQLTAELKTVLKRYFYSGVLGKRVYLFLTVEFGLPKV